MEKEKLHKVYNMNVELYKFSIYRDSTGEKGWKRSNSNSQILVPSGVTIPTSVTKGVPLCLFLMQPTSNPKSIIY